jgi:methionyl-tRNA formyltransferase
MSITEGLRPIDTPNNPELKIPSLKLMINGQGEGAATLFDKAINDGHEIVGVVTTIKKDKEGNPDPLRAKALEQGIPIINLGDLSNKNFDKYTAAKEKMKSWNADLGVGFYLQAILDEETIQIPKFGTMNMHLGNPANRGRDSMNRDIRDGKPTVSIMTYMMDGIVDGGPVVDVKSFPNPGDKSQGALYFQYLPSFVEHVRDSINKMAIGIDEFRKNETPLPITPQVISEDTYYPPLTKGDLAVDFEKMDAITIKNYMNAGGPGATTIIEGQEYKISKPEAYEGPTIPGRIVETDNNTLMEEAYQGIVKIGRFQKAI